MEGEMWAVRRSQVQGASILWGNEAELFIALSEGSDINS